MKLVIVLALSVASLNAFADSSKEVCKALKKDFLSNVQGTHVDFLGKNSKGHVCEVSINVYESKCDLYIDPNEQDRAYINLSRHMGSAMVVKRLAVDENGIKSLEVSSHWKEQDQFGDLKKVSGSLSIKRNVNTVLFKTKVQSSIRGIKGNLDCKVQLN